MTRVYSAGRSVTGVHGSVTGEQNKSVRNGGHGKQDRKPLNRIGFNCTAKIASQRVNRYAN